MSALISLLIRDARSGVVREATTKEIMTAARACLSESLRRGAVLDSPQAACDYLAVRLGERQHEIFCLIYLDNRHRVIAYQELFRGTIDGANVHPREVGKEALKRNAAACLIVHFVAGHKMGVMCP